MINITATLRNIQTICGAMPDGVWGPETCRRIALRLGVPVVTDDPPSCLVVDVYHGDKLAVDTAARNGMRALIAKATQGTNYTDPKFYAFQLAAGKINLPFGSYHFGNGSDPIAQADHYLSTINAQPNDLVCLDFETDPHDSVMTPKQACAFVSEIHRQIGRWPVIYGGNRLKEELTNADRAVLCNCPLWLSQYGPHAVLPVGWTKYTLWQYTGDGQGTLSPKTIQGSGNRPDFLDISRFDGTLRELLSAWPF